MTGGLGAHASVPLRWIAERTPAHPYGSSRLEAFTAGWISANRIKPLPLFAGLAKLSTGHYRLKKVIRARPGRPQGEAS
jgi:hypothetical protein